MRSKFYWIFAFLLLGSGLALLLYPTVSDWWNSFHQSQALVHYRAETESMDEERLVQLWNEAAEYNRLLAENAEKDGTYEQMLAVNDSGIMGYLEIGKLDLSMPIYHGTDEAVLQVAIGHLPGSSLPVGGAGSHCVLTGHRGLPSARLFDNLDRMEAGDRFTLRVLDQILVYEVKDIKVILPHETDALAIEEGKDWCTLVTCTPYGVNSHRLLVCGSRVAGEENISVKEEEKELEKGKGKKEIGVTAGVIVFLVIIILAGRTVFAAGQKKGSLGFSLEYEPGRTTFSLYYVASIDADGKYVWQKGYDKYETPLLNQPDEALSELSEQLKQYVKNEKQVPVIREQSGEDGMLSMDGLRRGLYLLIGEKSMKEKKQYEPVPVLFSLPVEKENLAYEKPVLKIKYEISEPETPGNETLPQTGQLRWPVPFLFGGGAILILFGRKKKGGKE